MLGLWFRNQTNRCLGCFDKISQYVLSFINHVYFYCALGVSIKLMFIHFKNGFYLFLQMNSYVISSNINASLSLISLRWAGLHFIRPSECIFWPKASCMCVCFFPDNINKYKYKPCGRQVCQCLLCKYTVNANSTPPGSALYWKPFRERQIEMTEQFWDYLQRWRCIHLTKGDTELYCKYVQRFNLNFLTKEVSIMWSNFNLSFFTVNTASH